MKDFFKNFSEKTFVNNRSERTFVNGGMNFMTPTGCLPFQQEKKS